MINKMKKDCHSEVSSRFSYEESPTLRYFCRSIAEDPSREKYGEFLRMTKFKITKDKIG